MTPPPLLLLLLLRGGMNHFASCRQAGRQAGAINARSARLAAAVSRCRPLSARAQSLDRRLNVLRDSSRDPPGPAAAVAKPRVIRKSNLRNRIFGRDRRARYEYN